MNPTYFPRLPDHELIRQPKKLPKWWYDEIGAPPERNDQDDINGMGLEEAIAYLLGKHGELCREELLVMMKKNSSFLTSTLRILFKKKVVTFEDKAKSRKWRLLKPGEKQTVVLVEEIRGQLQRRAYNLMLLLHYDPSKWFTVYELAKALSVAKASKVTSALFGLFSMGLAERRAYDLEEGRPHQVKTHPYVYRALKP